MVHVRKPVCTLPDGSRLILKNNHLGSTRTSGPITNGYIENSKTTRFLSTRYSTKTNRRLRWTLTGISVRFFLTIQDCLFHRESRTTAQQKIQLEFFQMVCRWCRGEICTSYWTTNFLSILHDRSDDFLERNFIYFIWINSIMLLLEHPESWKSRDVRKKTKIRRSQSQLHHKISPFTSLYNNNSVLARHFSVLLELLMISCPVTTSVIEIFPELTNDRIVGASTLPDSFFKHIHFRPGSFLCHHHNNHMGELRS